MTGLIYSFVARERTVLAEYSALAGNFRTVAVECLQNSQITDDKFTVTADAYTFNYLIHSGYSKWMQLLPRQRYTIMPGLCR